MQTWQIFNVIIALFKIDTNTPKNYMADGKFKKIEVKVKGKKYKVTHRAGYIAD